LLNIDTGFRKFGWISWISTFSRTRLLYTANHSRDIVRVTSLSGMLRKLVALLILLNTWLWPLTDHHYFVTFLNGVLQEIYRILKVSLIAIFDFHLITHYSTKQVLIESLFSCISACIA